MSAHAHGGCVHTRLGLLPSTTTSHPLLPAQSHVHGCLDIFLDSRRDERKIRAVHSRAAGAGPGTMKSRSPGTSLSIYQASLPRGRHGRMFRPLSPGLMAAELAVVQARLKLQSPLPAISRALYK